MKIPQDPASTQALGQFIIMALGRVIMIGVVVALVAAWVLTESFYELSKWISHGGKLRAKQIEH